VSHRETAGKVLNEYLEAAGGREEILRNWEEEKAELAAKKGKKRARSSTGVDTPTNGAKRGRKPKLEHPLESTPPASASHGGDENFVPPTGNWEEQVKDIDACEGQGGVPIVFITWKSGHKSQHPLHQVYKRCPQKVSQSIRHMASILTCLVLQMLQFYERHL
jgi:chromobox protein 1